MPFKIVLLLDRSCELFSSELLLASLELVEPILDAFSKFYQHVRLTMGSFTSSELLNFVKENVKLSFGIGLVLLLALYKIIASRSNINMSHSIIVGGFQDGSTNKTILTPLGEEQKPNKISSPGIERISKNINRWAKSNK